MSYAQYGGYLQVLVLFALIALGAYIKFHKPKVKIGLGTAILGLLVPLIASLMLNYFTLGEIAAKNTHYTIYDSYMSDHCLDKEWPGAAAAGREPSMGIVRFKSKNGEPFVLRLGIRVKSEWLGLDWFHTYGHLISHDDGTAVVRTWLGKNPIVFTYMSTLPASEIEVDWSDEVQHLEPQRTDWPHWYQQWPLYWWG